MADVSWQAGHRGEKEQREKRSKHASYVMIIRKHRGRLFSTQSRLQEAPGWGPKAQGPGPLSRCAGRRNTGREEGAQHPKKTGKIKLDVSKKREKKEDKWSIDKNTCRHGVLMTAWPQASERAQGSE